MADTKAAIEAILAEISSKGKSVGIIDDKDNIRQFLAKEINGDILTHYLVTSANLSKDRPGVLVYLLTSAKIVKIEIDKEKVQSFSSYLKEVTGVTRSLLNDPSGNNARIMIEFVNGNFGLIYPSNNTTIDSFFQSVDEAVRKIKVTKGTTDGN